MKLDGKVAIVTGGGQGIGRAIALRLAKEGADVVVNDINMETASSVADEIKAIGRRALAIKADVSNSQEVNEMVETTLRELGKVDILVNNAGTAYVIPTEELAEDIWDRSIDINLKGPFLCSQAVGREMIKQKQGKIVNIASGAGLAGIPKMLAYCASKGGVVLLSQALAVEWAKYNINVNTVCPGFTVTPMTDAVRRESPQTFEHRERRIPLHRVARPEDIAEAVVFFTSPESNYITGQTLSVDGGTTAIHPGYVE